MASKTSVRSPWRCEFPILDQEVNGKPLVYLDSAASGQKPRVVLDTMDFYYRMDNANVHRGVHTLGQRSTDAYDRARATVAKHLNASRPEEVVFTKGCTESLNLVASSWGGTNLKAGDVVLCSVAEHHANLVPWQMVAQRVGARVLPVPVFDDGQLDWDAYVALLRDHPVKMVAVKHVCNALGTVYPVKRMAEEAHQAGALITADGAQAVPHMPVDVRDLGVDFYSVAGHKAFGPMGVGALYGRSEHLKAMPPYQGGGDMIRTVSFEGTTFREPPTRFEAGTPNVAGVVGMAAGLEWLAAQDSEAVQAHEAALTQRATASLEEVSGVTVLGKTPGKAGVVSFVTDFAHPHDLATILDSEGVAVRAGHHCCMPLMQRLQVSSTVRASFAVYNDDEDVEALVRAVAKAKEIFS